MAPPKTEGTWPYVDIVVIKDYKQDKKRPKPSYTLRIHMDIPGLTKKELDDIDCFLTDGDNERVLAAVLASNEQIPADSTGVVTLAAALGMVKMDPSLLPAPKTNARKTPRPSA